MDVVEFSYFLANPQEGFPIRFMSWYRVSQSALYAQSSGSCHNPDSDSGGLGWCLRFCISNKFLADVDGAGPTDYTLSGNVMYALLADFYLTKTVRI